MTKEEAKKILTEYVKACREDDMLTLEQFTYEEVIEAMDIGAEAISVLPVSSDLDEAAKKCVTSIIYEHGLYDGDFLIPVCEDIFKSGAEWDREQIMKDVVNTTVHLESGANPVIEIGVGRFGLKVKDKVKVIIVKEDNHE